MSALISDDDVENMRSALRRMMSRNNEATHVNDAMRVMAMCEHYLELRDAIIGHRLQRADDRCISDDDELYAALRDGITCDRRVGSQMDMAVNCIRFIRNRTEGGCWPSYVELEAKIKQLEKANKDMADMQGIDETITQSVDTKCRNLQQENDAISKDLELWQERLVKAEQKNAELLGEQNLYTTRFQAAMRRRDHAESKYASLAIEYHDALKRMAEREVYIATFDDKSSKLTERIVRLEQILAAFNLLGTAKLDPELAGEDIPAADPKFVIPDKEVPSAAATDKADAAAVERKEEDVAVPEAPQPYTGGKPPPPPEELARRDFAILGPKGAGPITIDKYWREIRRLAELYCRS